MADVTELRRREDPDVDETLQGRRRRCAFCRIVFEAALTGRPPTSCSKLCRQAASRERTGTVRGGASRAQARRRSARIESELDAGVPLLEAIDRARAAWPHEVRLRK